jgi:oligosaccharide repeat unit polymerase
VALSVAVGAAGLIPLVAAGMGPASMVAAVLGGRWSDKPWAYWGNLGNESSWYLFLAQSAQIVASALLFAVSVQRRESRQARAWAFVVGAVLLVISFFDQGVRSLTALVVMPTFLLVFVRRRTKSPRSAIALGGLAVLVMFFVSQFQMLFRAPYSRRDLAGLFFEDWPTLGRQIDYFREHLFAISIVPNLHGFFKESVILEFLASPIPRFLWPGKPASEVVWFYTLCRWGVDIWTRPGNIFPGVVGQFYMSWSWFGPVFAGVIFGVASWGGDRFLARHGPEDDPFGFVLGSMLACLLFLSFRNLAPAPFYPLLLAALIVRASRGSGGGLCRRRLATGPGADTSVGDE